MSPTQYMNYAQTRTPERMMAELQRDVEKHFRSGTDRRFEGYDEEAFYDIKYWGDRVDKTWNPNKAAQTNLFTRASSRYNTSPWTQASQYDIYNRWDQFNVQYAEEQAAEQARIQAYIDEQAALQASGVPAWEIDPTPEDAEITTADKVQQMTQKQEHLQTLLEQEPEVTTGHDIQQPNVTGPGPEESERVAPPTAKPPEVWRNDRGETREEEAARLAQEEAALIRQRQLEGEQQELGELWGYRSQSEALAKRDVYGYLLDTSTEMALRGVKSPFTKEYQQDMLERRFGEYWSEENEARMMQLAEGTEFKHGLPGQRGLFRSKKATNLEETGLFEEDELSLLGG